MSIRDFTNEDLIKLSSSQFMDVALRAKEELLQRLSGHEPIDDLSLLDDEALTLTLCQGVNEVLRRLNMRGER